jgi:hypothetical protein
MGQNSSAAYTAADAEASNGSSAAKPAGQTDGQAVSSSGTGDSSTQSAYNAILAQRKIIQNADVTVEVDNFDQAYSKLKSAINAFGFVQETNIHKDLEE